MVLGVKSVKLKAIFLPSLNFLFCHICQTSNRSKENWTKLIGFQLVRVGQFSVSSNLLKTKQVKEKKTYFPLFSYIFSAPKCQALSKHNKNILKIMYFQQTNNTKINTNKSQLIKQKGENEIQRTYQNKRERW